MNFRLEITPEEYALIHKGLSKLSIEEALPTLNRITEQVKVQISNGEGGVEGAKK